MHFVLYIHTWHEKAVLFGSTFFETGRLGAGQAGGQPGGTTKVQYKSPTHLPISKALASPYPTLQKQACVQKGALALKRSSRKRHQSIWGTHASLPVAPAGSPEHPTTGSMKKEKAGRCLLGYGTLFQLDGYEWHVTMGCYINPFLFLRIISQAHCRAYMSPLLLPHPTPSPTPPSLAWHFCTLLCTCFLHCTTCTACCAACILHFLRLTFQGGGRRISWTLSGG